MSSCTSSLTRHLRGFRHLRRYRSHVFELADGLGRARRTAAAADPELAETFAGCPVAAITADPAEGG
jgi:hypothetical protein